MTHLRTSCCNRLNETENYHYHNMCNKSLTACILTALALQGQNWLHHKQIVIDNTNSN